MTRHDASAGHIPRLVISWLIVGALLAYGVSQAIMSSVPLFVS